MKQKQLYAHRCGIQRIGITVHWHRSKKKNIIRILLSLTKLVFVQTVRNGNSGIRAACDNQIFRVNFSKQLCWIFDSNENDIYCLVMQTLIVGFEVCAHVCVCVCVTLFKTKNGATVVRFVVLFCTTILSGRKHHEFVIVMHFYCFCCISVGHKLQFDRFRHRIFFP